MAGGRLQRYLLGVSKVNLFAKLTPFLDRRQFLSGSAVSLLAATQAWADDLVVEETGHPPQKGCAVRYRGKSWVIDPTLFGPAARVTFTVTPASADPLQQVHRIRLAGARYPGLSVVADFAAEIYSRAGNWFVRIKFADGPAVELDLALWIDSSITAPLYFGSVPGNRIAIGSGPSHIVAEAGRLRYAIDSQFKMTCEVSDGSLAFKSPRVEFTAKRARLALLRESGTAVPKGVAGPVTVVAFEGLQATASPLSIGGIAGGQAIKLAPEFVANPPQAQGLLVGFVERGRHDALLELGGQGTNGALIVESEKASAIDARVWLEDWTLVGRANHLAEHLVLSANIARKAFALETKSLAITIGGDESEPIRETFGAKLLRQFAFRARLYSAHVPVRGASGADLSFDNQFVEVAFGESGASSAQKAPAVCNARLSVDAQQAVFVAPLEAARMRLRRSLDGFDLAFGFSHYALRVQHNKTELVQRWAFAAGCSTTPSRPQLIVHFPPQYEFEEAFVKPNEAATTAALSPSGKDKARPLLTPPRGIEESSPDLARTKLSNPTRLVFQDPSADGKPGAPHTHELAVHELTVRFLTDWEDLALVVNKRALKRSATLQDQLDCVGILPGDTRQQAKDKIRGSVGIGLPDPNQTSIESVYRLIVSPDSTAGFITPKLEPTFSAPKLWSASLKDPEQVAVRALWARGMDLGFLEGGNHKETAPKFDGHFAGSLNANDRRELVAMSSIYGLAALRRLIPANGSNPAPAKPTCGADGHQAPPFAWQDDPNGMVFMPTTTYAYLDPTPPTPGNSGPSVCPADANVPQEGIVVAKPFDRFRLTLGRAPSLDALWKGEPPAAYEGPYGAFFSPAFTIEKYLHRSQQSRDVFVEVTYKGFLFPLGHRAAFLKMTSRQFYPYRGRDGGGPTGYLIQEYFIVCQKPLKTYQAFNQPYDSRDFPCSTVELVTTRTGNLKVPEAWDLLTPQPKNENTDTTRPIIKPTSDTTVGNVFWPTSLDGKRIKFEIRIDGDRAVARMPLLFVDNAAVHNAATVKNVVQTYNALTPTRDDLGKVIETDHDDDLQRVHHVGAVRRYAEEVKPAGCSFRTFDWIMGARGRLGPNADADPEAFQMDAFMEGSDQPPFYPVVRSAAVNIEQLDRLTGKSGQRVAVVYDPLYIKNGFDPVHNPSQIYLDILKPDIGLDAVNSGGATGGVSSTNSLAAAWSRQTGVVGGQKSVSPPSGGDVLPKSLPAGASGSSPYAMASAQAGRCDPVEFFDIKAKLLGTVSFKDILRVVLMAAAPKLAETVDYGVAAAEQAAAEIYKQLRGALQLALPTVETAAKTAVDGAQQKLADLAPGLPLSIQELYPDLYFALSKLQTQAGAAKKQVADLPDTPAGDAVIAASDALYHVATDVKSAVDGVVASIERIAKDPVPTVVREQLLAVQNAWSLLRRLFDDPQALKAFVDNLLRSAADAAFDDVCQKIVDAGLFEPFFGPLNKDTPAEYSAAPTSEEQKPPMPDTAAQKALLKRLLSNPADTLPKLEQALLYEALAEPMAKAMGALRRLDGEIRGTIAWSRQAVADRISGLLRRGARELPDFAFRQIASDMVDDIATDIDRIVATKPWNAIVPGIEASAKRAFDGQKTKIDAQLKTIEDQATAKVASYSKLIDQKTVAEIQADYEEAVRQRDRFKRYLEDVRKLHTLVHDPAAVNDLVAAISGELKTEIRKGVDRVLAEARASAQAQVQGFARRATDLVNVLFDWVLHSAQLQKIQAVTASLSNWCSSATQGLIQIVDGLTFGLLHDAAGLSNAALDVQKQLLAVAQKLGTVQIPDKAPPALRTSIAAAQAGLARSAKQIADLVTEFETLRRDWEKAKADTTELAKRCSAPAGMLNPVGRILNIRRRILSLISDTLQAATAAIASADSLDSLSKGPLFAAAVVSPGDIKTDLGNVVNALGVVMHAVLTDLTTKTASWSDLQKKPGGPFDQLGTALATAQSTAGALQQQVTQFETEAGKLRNDFLAASTPLDPKKLAAVATDAARFVSSNNRQLAGFILQGIVGANKALEAVQGNGLLVVNQIASLLLVPHQKASEALGTIVDLISTANSPLLGFVSQDLRRRLTAAKDAIDVDRKSLVDVQAAASPGPGASGDLQKVADLLKPGLIKRWGRGNVGLVLAFESLRQLVEAVAHGNFAAIFDVAEVRNELIDAVAELIPSRASLSYDFDAAVDDFPSDDPIFAMGREDFGDTKTEYTYDDIPGQIFPINDLVLTTQVNVDFRTGQRQVWARGRLRPFVLNLLGDRLDLVSIHFKGAQFEAKPGQSASFKADVSGVTIGSMLSFLESIQSFMSPKDGNGPYAVPRFFPPEIEVGYGYNQPLVQVGTLQFINIGFSVGAILPFDDRTSEFFFRFASRPRPFLIAQPPYGGGGYLGLRANPSGVVGFEIQLEFGAVISIEFGPLHGHGRITAGIYLESGEGRRVLEGFFHAIGEGQIACFGISVNIEIKTTQQDDSSMAGSATFAFSFKVGMGIHLDYSVTAGHKQPGSRSGGGAGPSGHAALDGIQPFSVAGGELAYAAAIPSMSGPDARAITAQALRKERDWKDYRRHLDL